MVLMAPSQWNNEGKKQRLRLWQCTRLPFLVKYPQRTARINEILKWTKEHLDACFASADVIIDQRDEPPG
jgi:hypothetical protein